MRVAIVGASGVLGRSTIRLLRARGSPVVGLVRSPEKARIVESLGGRAVIGDLLNPTQVRAFVEGSEAVLHLATAIPLKPRTTRRDWAANDRLRREGTRNLVEACRGLPVRAYVQQSVGLVYGDLEGDWADESFPPQPTDPTQSAVDGEHIALDAHRDWGLPAVVLRGANFYHAKAWHTHYMIKQLKKRQLPIIGDGSTYWHYIHVDDMALAIVCALDHCESASGEIFNVADDAPFQARELLEYLAGELGAARPYRIPVWLARWLAGAISVYVLTTSARYRTDRAKRILGWTPQYPTYHEGFGEVLNRFKGDGWQKSDNRRKYDGE